MHPSLSFFTAMSIKLDAHQCARMPLTRQLKYEEPESEPEFEYQPESESEPESEPEPEPKRKKKKRDSDEEWAPPDSDVSSSVRAFSAPIVLTKFIILLTT